MATNQQQQTWFRLRLGPKLNYLGPVAHLDGGDGRTACGIYAVGRAVSPPPGMRRCRFCLLYDERNQR